jgi:tetratricopeptide (TPR) repeat protein
MSTRKRTPVPEDDAPAFADLLASAWQRFYWLIPPLLAVLGSINTLRNGFVHDDSKQVVGNALIRSLGNIPAAFTSSVWSFAGMSVEFALDTYYRPLFSTLFTITYAIFETRAWGWHLVNVLIHAAVTLLVFVVLNELSGRRWESLAAASLFAVHPVHAESVAWISGVTDPLMALFLLPSFYFYLRYRKGPRTLFMIASASFYFLALLSKETAVALPAVIASCELLLEGKTSGRKPRLISAAVWLLIFAVPTAIYIAMRSQVLTGVVLGALAPQVPVVSCILTSPLAMVKYLQFMFVPLGYSIQHHTDLVPSVMSIWFLAPLAGLVASAGAIWWSKSTLLKFSALWYVITLLPAIAGMPRFSLTYLVQERYLYLPSIGACFAIALGLGALARSKFGGLSGRSVAAAAAVLIVIVLGALNLQQNRIWLSDITVGENAIARSGGRSEARLYVVGSYYSAGRRKDAEAQATRALEISPGKGDAYAALSSMANAEGNLDKAIEYLERGIAAVKPVTTKETNDVASLQLNLGLMYARRGQTDLAEQTLLKSVELWPRPTGFFYTGQFYYDLRRFDDAREYYEKVRDSVPPSFFPIQLRLGMAYERLGMKDQARAAYERFLELAPDDMGERVEAVRGLSRL